MKYESYFVNCFIDLITNSQITWRFKLFLHRSCNSFRAKEILKTKIFDNSKNQNVINRKIQISLCILCKENSNNTTQQ